MAKGLDGWRRRSVFGVGLLLGLVCVLGVATAALPAETGSGELAVSGPVDAGSATVPVSGSADDGSANVSLYVTDEAGFDDAEAIRAGIDGGTVEPAERVVVGQTLVVAIDSARLAEDLADRQGPPTQRLFGVLSDEAYLRLLQTNPGPNRQPKVLHLGPDNTTAYRNGSTTYVTVDTGAVAVRYSPLEERSGSDPQFRGGDRFAARFGYDTAQPRRSNEVQIQLAEAAFTDTYAVLAPEIVNGSVRVAVEPEEALLVRATFEDGSTITESPGAVPWSTYSGFSLDLRNRTAGTNVTLELVHDGEVVDRQNGTVRAPTARLRGADLTVVDSEHVAAVLGLTATLSHGGEVIVLDEFGDQVGASSVPAGETTEVAIEIRPGPDADREFDPETLRVHAVRRDGQIEKRYPGPDATLTVDVSEYEWGTTDFTPTPENNGTDGATGSAGTATPDGTPTVYTVGDGTDDPGIGFDALVLGIGLVGAVVLVGSTGYLLGRRLNRR